ncbi:MAG: Copper-exporting P-type ATPase [Chlamydiales bacterium]|nr:Copper-exporting P-type ATPase [Chlamydiales bacterium]
MSCKLCSLQLPKNPILDEQNAFCCSGCLTVFNILGAQENYKEHPLFQEALSSGVISNPALHQEREFAPTLLEKMHLQIDQMWCSSCAQAIQLILRRQKGVSKCVVDYATDLAVIEYNPCIQSKEQINSLIQKIGYTPSELLSDEKQRISRSLWLRFGVAAFCTLNLMMYAYPLYISQFGIATEGYERGLGWLSLLLSIPLITYCAWPIWRRLKVTLYSRLFGMETLVFIGVFAAFITSLYSLLHDTTHLYFDSMAMVITFVLLGKILEKKAKFSVKQTLFQLTRSLPKKGYKQLSSGEFGFVPLKEIKIGDIILVRTGEKIILDGLVIKGQGLVDESVMTGEAMPVLKQKQSAVIGGSFLKQGVLTIEVTKDQTESLLGKILDLIENDLAHKSKTERLVDRITRYFVPTILGLAAATFFLAGPIRALTLLLISCPCALGIATPLVQSRLLFSFAKKGALIRNRSCLSLLAQNPLFVFDKTGTLTEGKFKVLKGLDHLSTHHQSLLKTLTSHSTHPISFAISDQLNSPTLELESIEEMIGRGLEATYAGKRYLLGSERLCQERGIAVQTHLSTTVYFVENTTVLAEIHLGDQLRSNLPAVKGIILSGDSPKLVENIVKQCGFLWGKGGLDPLQKREEILKLKKEHQRPIVMVGDGVNDAPAMSVADVGISVVSATDVAIEVSDILLTTEHLEDLSSFVLLAKKGKKIQFQNLFWAFFYNSIGVGLALFGALTPFYAALAMVISSLFVSLNSMRIRLRILKSSNI